MKLPALLLVATIASFALGCSGDDPAASPLPEVGAPSCGNGVLDAQETCDGPQLGAASCESLGLGTGSLRCSAGCTLDHSRCGAPPTCGNGSVDGAETCDGAELMGNTCAGLGFASGALACNERCTGFDTSACQGGSCTPKTCESAGAACGTTDDGCGGTLECGDSCQSTQPWLTCGGAGTPNTCGATCLPSCPAGSVCNANGVCGFVPNPPLALVTHRITFRFLLDGAPPTDTANCTNPLSTVASFLLQNQTPPSESITGTILCGSRWTTAPMALSAGSYLVQVTARDGASNMPPLTAVQLEVPVGDVDGEVLVDVATARVRGSIVLDGLAPVESGCSAGQLVGTLEFHNERSQILTVPVPCGGGFTFDGRMLLGDYRVVLRGTGRSNLPLQRVLRSQLHVAGPVDDLVLDAGSPTTTVTGALTFNGSPPTTAAGCNPFSEAARVTFSQSGEDPVFTNLPCSGPFTYSVQLRPGTYRVSARSISSSGINEPEFQRDFPELVVGAQPAIYDVDVPLVEVTGRVTLGGQLPTEDVGCAGNAALLFVGSRSVPVPCQSGFTFGSTRFVPGTYGAFVSASASTNLPSTSAAFVVPPQGGPIVVDVVPSHSLRLTFTVNGAQPADCDSGESMRVNLRSANGYTQGAGIACGAGFATTLTVPAGVYELETTPSQGGSFPHFVRQAPVQVQGDTVVSIDIATRQVSGQVLLNGVAPVETAACTSGQVVAEVLFVNVRNGAANPLVSSIRCGTGFGYGPVPLASGGIYSIRVRPVGSPARSNMPPYEYVAVSRFQVD